MTSFQEIINYVKSHAAEKGVPATDDASVREKSPTRRPLAPTISSLERVACALKADTEFDDVDFGWEPERDHAELTIVVEGNKYEVRLQFTASLYNGPQPPMQDGMVDEPGNDDYLAYEVHAEWDYLDLQGRERVALCNDETTLLALLRGLREMTQTEEPKTRIDFAAPFQQSTQTHAQALTAWARKRERLHHLVNHHPEEVEQAEQEINILAGEFCADLIGDGAIEDANPHRCPHPSCRPVLLLDVDGVLNPHLEPDAAAAAGYRRHTFTLTPYQRRISPWLNPQHGQWLRELAEHLQLVWCTSWEHAAAQHIAPVLGLPEMAVVEVGPMGGAVFDGRSAKADAVNCWLGNRPAVWLDDVHGVGDHQWARDRNEDCDPTLLVTVNPTQGFIRPHVDVILQWLHDNQLIGSEE
ncbi:HAD domain-containing protein [Actinomadura sp. NPDC048955]|uniref:HAD domain-containing protein n=1 Tax=Actinomadura sp. NPDC048955 TaxID=3158228 RepID=UPI0033EC9865